MNAGPFIFLSCLALALFFSQPIVADEKDDRIKALEQRLELLEKRLGPTPPADGSKPSESPRPSPSLSVGASGFTMRSADSNFVLRIRALLQLDSRWSDDDSIDDSFLVRRARPI